MNWQPKEGEWLYNYPDNCLMEFYREQKDAYGNQIIGAKNKKRDVIWYPKTNFRPAVLSDFAVEIPDYGKVWFVDGDVIPNHVTVKKLDEFNDFANIRYYAKKAFSKWELEAVISHYNITVMPENLFKKLSEADNG